MFHLINNDLAVNDRKDMQLAMLVVYWPVIFVMSSHSRIDIVFSVPFGAITNTIIFRMAVEDTGSNMSCFKSPEGYSNGWTYA